MAPLFARSAPEATGVAYSRNYQSGTPRPTGVFVVEGGRPAPLAALQAASPTAHRELLDLLTTLEREHRLVQQITYALQDGELCVISNGTAGLSPRAAIRVAFDMVNEGLLSRREALLRIQPTDVDALMAPVFAAGARQGAVAAGLLLTKGLGAFRGAASGQVALAPDTVTQRLMAYGPAQILLTDVVLPQEVASFYNSVGVVMVNGGINSPAGLAARKWSIPCVVGCSDIRIDRRAGTFSVGDRTYPDGHWISIDGTSGEIISGPLPVEDVGELTAELQALLGWADEAARVQVFGNADWPEQVDRARRWGGRGVGLCRTERLLNQTDRLHQVYPLIMLAPEAEGLKRRVARMQAAPSDPAWLASLEARLAPLWDRYQALLADLRPLLLADFTHLLRVMDGRPVTVRLLDAPLNKFLPAYEDMLVDLTQLRVLEALGIADPDGLVDSGPMYHFGRDMLGLTMARKEELLPGIRRIQQKNPSFGLRFCRQGILYPEIYRVQVRALFEAALSVERVQVQIMVPGISDPRELQTIKTLVAEVAAETGMGPYRFGTMIELPRACVLAGELAALSDFFWCGTNDLTQATYGHSNFDASYHYLPVYLEEQIMAEDLFCVLDVEGVGELLKLAVQRGRAVNPELAIGICGDHGADPGGIRFCHEVGINYVSTDPRRIPGARLAAAQAALTAATGERG